MRVVIVWRENADYSRAVSEWIRDLQRRTGREIESLDPDSADGEALCRAYDVVEYPSILAISDDSKLIQMWRGATPSLPRIDDVNYYLIEK